MSLSSDKIEIVKQFTKALREWPRKKIDPNIGGPENTYQGILHIALFGHVFRKDPSLCNDVLGSLHDPIVALRIKMKIEKLLERATEVDRGNETLDDVKDYAAEIAKEIEGIVRRETQPSGGDKTTPKPKEPSKEAQQAYKLYYSGMKQKDVAKKMTDKLKRRVSQGQVSKWIKQYKKWRKAEGIPVNDKKPNIITNSEILDIGARTDGRITGDPLHNKNADYGDNDFNE